MTTVAEGGVMAKTAHTRVHKGKRVVVFLRGGDVFADYFEAYTGNAIVLREHGRVAKADVRALVMARGDAFLAARHAGLPAPAPAMLP